MREKKPRIKALTLARAREFRQMLTPAEKLLWNRLRNRQLSGFKFRRQHPTDSYILDFYCPEKHLAIEIDGDSHEERLRYDQIRTEFLKKYGYKVIRFSNHQVHFEINSVLDEILQACNSGKNKT